MPTMQVQVAFQNNPYDTSLTWTDITRYVMGLSTTMGRQHELQQVQPSTATITLTNQDGRFSPWNTSSPYYYSGSGLTPGHPVRVTATWSGTTYPVFYGYAKGWVPAYGAARATMTLQCYDVLALLNLNTLDTGQYGVFPTANAAYYWPLNDGVTASSAAPAVGGTALNVLRPPVAFGYPGPFLTTADTSVNISSGGVLAPASTISISSTAISWELWCKGTSYGNGELLTFGGGDGIIILGGYPYSYGMTATHRVDDGNWHHIVMSSNGTTASLYVDGVLNATTSAGPFLEAFIGLGAHVGTAFPATSATLAQVAIYTTALTATQVANQYAIGTAGFLTQDTGARISAILATAGLDASQYNVGAGTVQVEGSTSSLAATTAMSYINTVTNTERGLVYQDPAGVVQFRNRHYVYENAAGSTSNATFGYASGQIQYLSTGLVPGTDDLDLWNNILVNRNGGIVQRAADATSQAKYGRRTLSGYTGLLFTNDGDSLDLAQGLLYQYKNPSTRVRSLTLSSTINAGAALPQMLGRQLLDRITINWRPIDGTSVDFSQQSLIEQVTHTVTPDQWTTTFAVTPVGTESFFILGTSLLGTGILGF
jgi:Concanavalin A-like lectin/glucanases superfamily